MQFDLSNPEIHVSIVEERPTQITFVLPIDAFERPEAALFAAVAEYLGSVAFERLDVDAFTVRYQFNDEQQKLLIADLYTRVPLDWVEFGKD